MAKWNPIFTDEELQSETWRQIPGYEGIYEVSDLGRVKSFKNYAQYKPNRLLAVSIGEIGYPRVTLWRDRKQTVWHVHQLVALAFMGKPPAGYMVNHKGKDGDKTNNRLGNLEYVTHKGNMEHAKLNGLLAYGERNKSCSIPSITIGKVKELIAGGLKGAEIARQLNLDPSTVSKIRLGKSRVHG